MDHREATRIQAAERYTLGELSGEEQEEFETHFFSCRECAEEVASGALFVANAREVFPKLHREELAAPSRSEVRPASWRRLFWPAPIGVLAGLVLALAALAYQTLFVPLEAPTIEAVPSHFLSVSRSDAPVIQVSKGDRMVALTLSKSSEQSFPYSRCEVRDESGRTLLSEVVSVPPGDELQILLPVAQLQPGAYVLVVTGLESPSGTAAEDSAQYHFRLEHIEKEERGGER
jgi:hypothetical protein